MKHIYFECKNLYHDDYFADTRLISPIYFLYRVNSSNLGTILFVIHCLSFEKGITTVCKVNVHWLFTRIFTLQE